MKHKSRLPTLVRNTLVVLALAFVTCGGFVRPACAAISYTLLHSFGSASDGTHPLEGVLPGDTNANNGTHTFRVTLKSAYTQSITATDVMSSSISGTASTYVDAAHMLRVIAPSTVTVGVPFHFTVQAIDAYSQVVPGYSGTVMFSTNTSHATLPAASTLTNGVGDFTATFRVPGTTAANFKITAADAFGIGGTSARIVVTP